MIIHQGRDEDQFKRAVTRASLRNLEKRSPGKLFAPIHFAVLWPPGLKILLQKGVDANTEDFYGRRPIHIAVALGLVESVECLISADCALYSPKTMPPLLQTAQMLLDPTRQRVFDLVSAALIDRHTRLLQWASSRISHMMMSTLCASAGKIRERIAPRLIEMLASHAIDVPDALILDGDSVYGCACNEDGSSVRMRAREADIFWNAGFTDIDEPND
jgi:hypothetical protein